MLYYLCLRVVFDFSRIYLYKLQPVIGLKKLQQNALPECWYHRPAHTRGLIQQGNQPVPRAHDDGPIDNCHPVDRPLDIQLALCQFNWATSFILHHNCATFFTKIIDGIPRSDRGCPATGGQPVVPELLPGFEVIARQDAGPAYVIDVFTHDQW